MRDHSLRVVRFVAFASLGSASPVLVVIDLNTSLLALFFLYTHPIVRNDCCNLLLVGVSRVLLLLDWEKFDVAFHDRLSLVL